MRSRERWAWSPPLTLSGKIIWDVRRPCLRPARARHSPHVLAFDRDHGIGQLLDDLSLLILAENVLDDSNLNERHFDSPVTARLTRAGECLTLEKSDIDNSRVSQHNCTGPETRPVMHSGKVPC